MAEQANAITAISVKGFKSFATEQRIEIRPLTILAGANSSGKSSAFQPLLLLKQTLEETYDPGPLQLNGPNVHFTSVDQLLTRVAIHPAADRFEIGIETSHGRTLRESFRKNPEGGFDLISMAISEEGGSFVLRPGMTSGEVKKELGGEDSYFPIAEDEKIIWAVVRNRCFIKSEVRLVKGDGSFRFVFSEHTTDFDQLLRSLLHVPGLRGNPARTYKTAAVGKVFPGTFENYVASLIMSWQQTGELRLGPLNNALEELGLTCGVQVNPVDATQVEILVGRLPKRKKKGVSDLVNIADVGFGVSQTLPVLVALLAAQPGQLVYLEQPELHLHPRAEQALATVLAEAAGRGVRVVVETHSSLLLLAIQALVAEGKLPPDQVILHWFQRDSRGATQVKTADLDRMGAYGDWPADFYSVGAELDNRYLDAVEAIAFGGKKKIAKGKR